MTDVFRLALGTDINFTAFFSPPTGGGDFYSDRLDRKQKPNATPYAIVALLLLALPLLYTAQKSVVEDANGERSQ